jgi:hypothetical protein
MDKVQKPGNSKPWHFVNLIQLPYENVTGMTRCSSGLRAGIQVFDFQVGTTDYPLVHSTKIGSGVHPASYTMAPRAQAARV